MTPSKKHLTINIKKLDFVKKINSILYPVKRYLQCSPSSTRGIERHQNPSSLNRQKIISTTRQISKKRITS